MKIKCPACAALLNIPDSAAGKVVKCPCGKQLRAPGGAAAPQNPAPQNPAAQRPATPTGQRPAAQRPAAQRPTPARPTPQRPAASSSGVDDDMFNELTEGDLRPVAAVARPGQARAAAKTSTAGGRLLQQYASGDVRDTGVRKQIAGVGARIGGALIDGMFHSIGFFIAGGVMAVLDPQEGEQLPVLALIGILVAVAIPPLINMVLISMSGQSIGKKVVKTRIVLEATGVQVGFMHGVLIRQFVFGMLVNIPCIGGFIALADIFYLFGEDAKTLHDRLAGTIVVTA